MIAAKSYLEENGIPVLRMGRDFPGSNWHCYFKSPDGLTVEVYYGMEQLGWQRRAKPSTLYLDTRGDFQLSILSELSELEAYLDSSAPIEKAVLPTARVTQKHVVGGGALSGNLAAAALKARLIAVGRLGGEKDELDIGQLAFKRITIRGVTFRSRTMEEQAAIVQSFANSVLPMVLDGRVKPVIDCVIPFEEAQRAMDHVGRNAHFGKTVLTIAA